MTNFIVLYREEDDPIDEDPLAFSCQAEDEAHAREQCENAYPGCDVVWTFEGDKVDVALWDYHYYLSFDQYDD